MADTTTLEHDPPEDSGPKGVGWHLRRAREEKGLTLDQVAAETRISRRHIEHIEAGQFDALPARAYAVGFSRTLAKTVGLDSADVVAMVRAEMQDDRSRDRFGGTGTFEPGDPARSPGGRLVWFSLLAVVLLLIGIFFAARVFFAPAAELPSLTQQEQAQTGAAQPGPGDPPPGAGAATPASAAGPVVFTATGAVWVRFYDAQDRVLTERTLAEGETYTVPADAVGPKIITGRPDLLTITVNGQAVPPLSTELVTVQDVDVSAAGLLAREAPVAATPPAATPAAATPAAEASAAATG